MSDKDGFKKLEGKINDNDMKLIWLYLSNTVSDIINKNENEYKLLAREYAINLLKLFDNAPLNSVFLIVDGEKNITKLNQMRREFGIASKCGDFKKCSKLGANISKEEYKFRQYPFWISIKNSKTVAQRAKCSY